MNDHKKLRFTWKDLANIQIDGVDTKDYPDFCDAYFTYAYSISLDRELTDDELDRLTDDYQSELHELAMENMT